VDAECDNDNKENEVDVEDSVSDNVVFEELSFGKRTFGWYTSSRVSKVL